ncbi:MAG: sulfatase [Bacteroidota bacterium]
MKHYKNYNLLHKKQLFISVPILFATSCGISPQNESEEQIMPNILFILTDDLGIHDLGVYGNDFHETPHLDSLANYGVRFTQAYAASPVCSPTRASILTGKNPAELHLTDWIPGKPSWSSEKLLAPEFNHELPSDEKTIASMLKEIGYHTASFGKWHLGDTTSLPTDHGFDINVAGSHSGLPPSYFYPYIKEDFILPDLSTGGVEGEFLTDRLTDEALEWIQEKKDDPFFMFLSYFTPHIWLETKPELLEKYTVKAQYADFNASIDPVYAGMIETLDNNIGKIMEFLQYEDLLENTIVVFYSDNGGVNRDLGLDPITDNGIFREGKGHLYEGGIRVPLIIYWKDQIEARTSDVPFISMDFVPTFGAMTGNNWDSGEGISFYDYLTQNIVPERNAMHFHYPHYSYQLSTPSGAIRSGDYKLIEFFEDFSTELYHIQKDPAESDDLSKIMPALRDSLQNKLHKWRDEVNAAMPVPNPDYEKEESTSAAGEVL